MRIRRIILTILALSSLPFMKTAHALTVGSFAPPGKAIQAEQVARDITQGSAVEREIAGEAHLYRVTLNEGQYLRAAVTQPGIDLAIRVTDPHGRQLAEVDNKEGGNKPERISVLSGAPGQYLIEVRPVQKNAARARYSLHLEQLRAATPSDSNYIAAQAASAEAIKLRRQMTAESLRKAVEKYEEALSLSRSMNDQWAEADLLESIGELYFSLGDLQSASESFQNELIVRRALVDRQGESVTLNNLGVVYRVLGETLRALEYYKQALPMRQILGDKPGEAQTLRNIGALYAMSDDYQEALEYLTRALDIAQAIGDRRGEAYSLHSLGAVYFSLGEVDNALEYALRALPLRQAVNDRRGEADTLNSIGQAYSALAEYPKAHGYYDKVLEIRRDMGDRAGEAYALNSIGEACALSGDLQRATEFYRQALEIRRAIKDVRGEADTLHNTGDLYEMLADAQKGLDHFQQALRIRRAIGDRGGESATLFAIARVERAMGRPAKALASIETALDIIESLRARVSRKDIQSFYMASKQRSYEFYIDLLMQLDRNQPSEGYAARALLASERRRARSLLEILAEARANIREGVDRALFERERAVGQRLDAKAERLLRLLGGRHTEQQAAEARKEIASLVIEYQDVQAQIRARSPRYAALMQPQPLSLREIQQQVLDEETLLLEYALGKDRSYLWAVTATGMSSYELPKREEIESAARRVYELLSLGNRREFRVQVKIATDKLSRIILAPVAAHMGKKRLLIVADGALQYIPFAALPSPALSGESPYSKQPLIADHEIVSLPSASVFALLRRELAGREPAVNALAVLADPVLQSDDPRVKAARAKTNPQKASLTPSGASAGNRENDVKEDALRSARESGVAGFVRLRYTRQEADAVAALAKHAGALKAVDFNASKATAKSADLFNYRIIHFATHGLINSIHPELSGIVLSLVDEEGQPQDGFLRLHDIYNLKLSADLVVLSACRTALGKEIRGEGLIGLTRGFMYAGAPRIVASLGDVRDEATAELIKRFYERVFKGGLRPAAALRAAQVSMLKEKRWEAPYFWASFIFQGEWR